jgi:hypothetical protein
MNDDNVGNGDVARELDEAEEAAIMQEVKVRLAELAGLVNRGESKADAAHEAWMDDVLERTLHMLEEVAMVGDRLLGKWERRGVIKDAEITLAGIVAKYHGKSSSEPK